MNSTLRLIRTGTLAALLSTSAARATVYYWDTTSTGLWATGANWSNNATSGGTTGTVPLSTDTVVFDQSSVNGAEIIQLNAPASIAGITFNNTGTTNLVSNGSAQTLTLGTGGINIAGGAGAVTLGDGTAANNVLISLSAGNQTWTNASSNAFTISDTAAPSPALRGLRLISIRWVLASFR